MTVQPVQECVDCGVHDFEAFMKQDEDGWHCKECFVPKREPDLVDFMDCKRDGGDR